MNFWALRICLYSYLGKKTLTLSELFKGAEFSFASPTLEVTIPDYTKVSVHQLLDNFPGSQTPKDIAGGSHRIFEECNKVFINGRNAPIDGLWLCCIGSTSSKLMIGFQMKLAEEVTSKKLSVVNSRLIEDEQPNILKVLDCLDNDSKFVFALMSNRHRSQILQLSNLSEIKSGNGKKHIDIVLVHRENFERFYGYTFSGRAQFSSMWLIPCFSISLISFPFVIVSTQLYINSAPPHYLNQIPGVGEVMYSEIIKERKRKRFDDQEDLLKRIPQFPRPELASIRY